MLKPIATRNTQLVRRRTAGATFPELAERYAMTPQRAQQIWKKYLVLQEEKARGILRGLGLSVHAIEVIKRATEKENPRLEDLRLFIQSTPNWQSILLWKVRGAGKKTVEEIEGFAVAHGIHIEKDAVFKSGLSTRAFRVLSSIGVYTQASLKAFIEAHPGWRMELYRKQGCGLITVEEIGRFAQAKGILEG